MNQIFFAAGVLLFPAVCTTLGAAGVFLLRRSAAPRTQRVLSGMAAGIMLAASVWSLLLPAIERTRELGVAAWVPPSAGLVLGVLTRSRGCYRIQWRGMRMHRGILRNIFVVGVPSALQLAITSFSNVFVQSYVNRFASSCMAGWAAYQKIDAFVILPMTTLSVTATTFVGQNVGAGNWDRAKQGIRCALAMATVVTGVLLVPLMVFAQPLCTLFNQEPEVLGYGVYFIRLISPFYLVANFNQIYAGALRGAGDAKVPMVIMLGSFVVFRQLYLFVTYQVAGTLLPVALGYPVGWVVCSGVLLWYYRSGRWMAHSLVTPAGRGTDRERE